MGWWKANLANESYICSEYISNLLGLDESGVISFEDFNHRILQEEQRHITVHSFDVQQFRTPCTCSILSDLSGYVAKSVFKLTNEEENTIIYSIAETQDGPDVATVYQAIQRSERFLHNI